MSLPLQGNWTVEPDHIVDLGVRYVFMAFIILYFFLLFIFLFDLCALPLLLKASFCLDFAAWKLLEKLSMRRDAMRCDVNRFAIDLIWFAHFALCT